MRAILNLMLLLITFSAFSQQKGPNIVFDNESHDFGIIKEEKGKVSVTFNFVNTGSEPLIINNVATSCGCTAPNWTKEPILPGKKGFISATYDPTNRPGSFNKSVTVTSNSIENATKSLTIKGTVEQKEPTAEELYPRAMGELRLKSNHISVGTVYKNSKKSQTLQIINTGKEKVNVGFTDFPKHITLKAIPEILEPGVSGIIEVIYDASLIDDWGFVVDRVNITVNGKTDADKRITISADLGEDYSKLTEEQLKNSPIVTFNKEIFDFGTIKQNQIVENNFVVSNKGNTDLIIHKVKSTCGCTVVQPEKNILKPGETTNFKTTFSAASRNGEQSKIVTVYTNDPKKSVVRLYVKGIVEP